MRAVLGGVLGLVVGAMGTASADTAVPIVPPPAHMAHLVKTANGQYTLPKSTLSDPAWTGVDTASIDGMKTLANVNARSLDIHEAALQVNPGAGCSEVGVSAASLGPANLAHDDSLIELPVTNLSGDYESDVRQATNNEQYRESCDRTTSNGNPGY